MRRGSIKNRLLDVWVGTPLLHLLAVFHRRHRPPTEIQRIGVMCSPALGDTLLFSGPLQDLRALYEDAEIVHICMQQNLAAAEMIPGADRRLIIDLTKPEATVRALRRERFDLLLDFTSWQRLTALYTLLSGARSTVGFRTAGMHRAPGYDRTVEHRADRHEVDNFRALLGEAFGLDDAACLHAPAVVLEEIAAVPFTEERAIVVLHPWASGQRSWLREWPEERWVELARRLALRWGVGETVFVVTGAPSDKARSEPMVERLRAAGLRAESFVSPDGFRTLTHLLRRAKLVVSVNTGVMHLAAIAGARVIAINGPNRNGRWGPVGPRAVGVEAPGDGCGFLHLGFNFDGNPTDCMERTSVERVYAAADALLAATAEVG
jgi:heptosyltransferase-3